MIGVFERHADPAADLGALDIGQTEVEHDEIGRAFLEEAQRVSSGARDIHLVAAAPEQRAQGPLNGDLVVDEQDACEAVSYGQVVVGPR